MAAELPPQLPPEVDEYRELLAALHRRRATLIAAAAQHIAAHTAWIRLEGKGHPRCEAAHIAVILRTDRWSFSVEWRRMGFIRDGDGRARRRDRPIPVGRGLATDYRKVAAQAVAWERPAVLALALRLQEYRREWNYLSHALRNISRATAVLGIPAFYLRDVDGQRAADPAEPAAAPAPATPDAAPPAEAQNSPYAPSYRRA